MCAYELGAHGASVEKMLISNSSKLFLIFVFAYLGRIEFLII